jgi:MarR family transcriptional regulator, organic hydroperoxide resistance regulator
MNACSDISMNLFISRAFPFACDVHYVIYWHYIYSKLFARMSTYDNLKLDSQLCFALYAATHAVMRAYRCGLDAAGITYTQYLVMLVLWEEDGVAVGKIAAKLQLDSATLTPLLKKLEGAGFITRTRNKMDERIVEIKLTTKGNALQDDIVNVQKEVACNTGLDAIEFESLRQSLHTLANKMNLV